MIDPAHIASAAAALAAMRTERPAQLDDATAVKGWLLDHGVTARPLVRVIEETVRLGRCRDHGVLGPGLVSILTATLPSAGTHPVLDLPTRSMVLIPAGTSAMKSAQVHSNQPRHETPSRHFSLGMFPVTQEQRATLAQGTNSSHFKGGCRPVESVTWDDALRFCDALSRFAGFVPV